MILLDFWVKEKVNKLNLENKVKFLGQREDVNELYQAMDIFLLPSLYEGLPVVGVEAQASGLLCILSSSMTKETKVLDSTVFVSLSDTPESWANVINKKFQRKDTTKILTDKGFNINSEAEKLESKYVKILGDIK